MRQIPFVPCLVGVAVALAVLLALGVHAGTLLAVGVALACPLMMILMMGGMVHGAHRMHTGHDGPGPEDLTSSEAGSDCFD